MKIIPRAILVLLPAIVLLFSLWKSLAQNEGHNHKHTHNEEERRHLNERDDRCGATEPNERDHAARTQAEAFSKFKAGRKGGGDRESSGHRIFTVCFHNPQWWFPPFNWFGHRRISDKRLQGELDHLNEAFTTASCCDSGESWCSGDCSPVDMGIQFVMARVDSDGNIIGTTSSTRDSDACITRRHGHRWMSMRSSGDEVRIKSALHVGDESTLNVYYIRIIGRGVLGFAYFPWNYALRPELDGAVIEPTAARGGVKRNHNDGDTLVHEVG
jgi:hypothetical protein